MKVIETIKLLQNAELKQLKVDDDAVLGFINLAILELHKKFVLWTEEATVNMVEGTAKYYLDGNDSNVVMDVSDHSLLMVDSIEDEDGENVTVNQLSDPYTVKTPKFHILQVSKDMIVQPLTVKYRAAPVFLTKDSDTIPLPSQFLESVMLYVAYKAQSSIKSGVKDENNTHFIRFDSSCKKLQMNGLYTPEDLSSNKFEQRGFV